MAITGTAGNDNLTGTDGDDRFRLFQGGDDIANGKAGNDVFELKAAFAAGDQIIGGQGKDTLSLSGGYSLTVTGGMVSGIEKVSLSPGFAYSFTWQAQFNGKMAIDASAFEDGQPLNFDGSAIANGAFRFICGSTGDYDITGGGGNDVFDIADAHDFIVNGGGGNDSFRFTDNYTGFERVVGNDDVDTVTFNGDYAAGLFLSQGNIFELGDIGLWGIEKVAFKGGHSYDVIVQSDITNDNGPLTINASKLGVTDTFELDLTNSQVSGHTVLGGAGDDVIQCSGASDRIDAGRGADIIVAGASFTELAYDKGDSNGTARDNVTGVDWAMDQFDVPVDVTGAVFANGFNINDSSFDADMKTNIDPFFATWEAVVVQILSGDMNGHYVLMVDANGTGAYDAGVDLAIELTSQTNVASFGAASFI